MAASQANIRTERMVGALLGTAVGDAVGLPYEGLSRRRGARFHRDKALEHRLILGRGLCSDDTEHACMVAGALLASGGDVDRFAKSLAWRMRGWLAGIPAGIGFATLRAILRLWIGFSAERSGVFSAGNGPAMRASLIGIYAADDLDLMKALVRVSTRITHTDPKAEDGALIVALAASLAAKNQTVDWKNIMDGCLRVTQTDEFKESLLRVAEHLEKQSSPQNFADAMGLGKGIGGYILHTVPSALFCWLRNPGDFRCAVTDVIHLGGDTDTTAAIVGALAGAEGGLGAIPQSWIEGIAEWPRTTDWMQQLAQRLSRPNETKPVPLFWPGLIPRNLIFTLVVLTHGFRRLLPPY
jgi:ADP-ribosyl-[dinitrogen reductase] hydrolase